MFQPLLEKILWINQIIFFYIVYVKHLLNLGLKTVKLGIEPTALAKIPSALPRAFEQFLEQVYKMCGGNKFT